MNWVFYVPIFIIGLLFGSFLNAYFWRIKQERSIWKGRSVCTHCKSKIEWFDNIPLVSFFVLRAKCRSCKQAISWQYPLVEFWMGAVFALIFFHVSRIPYPVSIFIPLAIDFFILWILTVIFLYDLKYKEILDSFTLIPAGILFVTHTILNFYSSIFPSALDMLIGVAIAAGFFLLQFVASKGRWIGGGDIRLGVLMGVILGWKLTLVALMLAYVLGAVVGVGLLLFKKAKKNSEIPFGTFLTIATFVVMFWGNELLGWYLSLLT